jgi:hypothetical protein
LKIEIRDDDLFRFLLLRPADAVKPEDKKVLQPSFVDRGGLGRGEARRP